MSLLGIPLGRWLDVSAFLRWWGQGLLLCLPEALRQRLTLSRARLVVVAGEAQLQLYDEHAGKRHELAAYERKQLTAGNKPEHLPKAGERQIVLELTPEQVLCRTVSFPLAAENNLRQVVGFEIDRLTPFNSDKVYYDAKIMERQVSNRTLLARLGVVPRTSLTPILAQMQVLGLVPETVAIAGDSSGLNLLSADKRRRRLNAGQRWRRLLFLLLVLTGLVALVLPFWQQRNIVVRLIPMVDTAEQEAQSVLALRDRLDNAAASSQFLLEKRRQSALLVDVLNELTVLMPDNTYLEQLSLRTGKLELRGQSAEATALISVVEDSELFGQVTFSSPVVKDQRTGRDRFVISAVLTPAILQRIAAIEATEVPPEEAPLEEDNTNESEEITGETAKPMVETEQSAEDASSVKPAPTESGPTDSASTDSASTDSASTNSASTDSGRINVN